MRDRSKDGRVVHCTLSPQPMKEAAAWLSDYKQFWEQSLDRLDDYLHELQGREKKHGRKE